MHFAASQLRIACLLYGKLSPVPFTEFESTLPKRCHLKPLRCEMDRPVDFLATLCSQPYARYHFHCCWVDRLRASRSGAGVTRASKLQEATTSALTTIRITAIGVF